MATVLFLAICHLVGDLGFFAILSIQAHWLAIAPNRVQSTGMPASMLLSPEVPGRPTSYCYAGQALPIYSRRRVLQAGGGLRRRPGRNARKPRGNSHPAARIAGAAQPPIRNCITLLLVGSPGISIPGI